MTESAVPLEAHREDRRRHLLRLLTAGPAVPGPVVAEMARVAGWPVPPLVTPVALRPDSRCVRGSLDPDLLADFADDAPYLLVPGGLTERRRAMLEAAFPAGLAAVGPTVGPGQAADSLRWARRGLALAAEGVLAEAGPLLDCDEHLVTLWLLADPALLDELADRLLGELTTMPKGRRERVTETLRAWLVTRGTAAEIAARLHIHPQTVRYRMRIIDKVFGERLADSDVRFGIEVVLRALALRERPGPRRHTR